MEKQFEKPTVRTVLLRSHLKKLVMQDIDTLRVNYNIPEDLSQVEDIIDYLIMGHRGDWVVLKDYDYEND